MLNINRHKQLIKEHYLAGLRPEVAGLWLLHLNSTYKVEIIQFLKDVIQTRNFDNKNIVDYFTYLYVTAADFDKNGDLTQSSINYFKVVFNR